MNLKTSFEPMAEHKVEMPTISRTNNQPSALETYFEGFRKHIIGNHQEFDSPVGRKKIIYADWTASGRLYQPIEDTLTKSMGPFVANTHTETSTTGASMTLAYAKARAIIKQHVNASDQEVLIATGTGMTGAINKLQRIIGFKIPERFKDGIHIEETLKPVVFITHMEHHSNQTSWLETIAKVVIIPSNSAGLVCLQSLNELVETYKNHPSLIASVTACSNVTGIKTDYHAIAKIMHQHGGLCFVDFACSAPYVGIDMNPEDPEERLEAIMFSPHKFLGGPGSAGMLIFNKALYKNRVPDNPGGGTVTYTNPWGDHEYFEDIETREDGGTPGFMQMFKVALAIKLKERMGVDKIEQREHEMNTMVFNELSGIDNLHLLAENHRDRLSIFSFYIDHTHYNLVVKILNDYFGIQARGGCSCAGTYGHYLLEVDQPKSQQIREEIKHGNLFDRPGWIRMSLHPTTSNDEVRYICEAIKNVATNIDRFKADYTFCAVNKEYQHKNDNKTIEALVDTWFE